MLGENLYEWGLLAWVGALFLVSCIDAARGRARGQALNEEDTFERRLPDASDEDILDPGELLDRSLDENLDSESNVSAWWSEATGTGCESQPPADMGVATARLCDSLERRPGRAIF